VAGRFEGVSAGYRLVSLKHLLDERARRRRQHRQELVRVNLGERVFEIVDRQLVTRPSRSS
jgi:hypothetical protein